MPHILIDTHSGMETLRVTERTVKRRSCRVKEALGLLSCVEIKIRIEMMGIPSEFRIGCFSF